MTFGVWLTRRFAHPVAPSGALWRTIWESPRPPINSYRQIIRFAGRGPRKSQEDLCLAAASCSPHSLLYPKVLGVKMSALPQPPSPRPPPSAFRAPRPP